MATSRLRGLALSAALVLLASCSSSGNGGTDTGGSLPDGGDSGVKDVPADLDVVVGDVPADTSESGSVAVEYALNQEKTCGLSFSGYTLLEVSAQHLPEATFKGAAGIKSVELYVGTEAVKSKQVDSTSSSKDGKYTLEIDVEGNAVFEKLKVSKTDAEGNTVKVVPDGKIQFLLVVKTKANPDPEPSGARQTIQLNLDRSGPTLIINSPTSVDGAPVKTQGALDVSAGTKDSGTKAVMLRFFVGDLEVASLENPKLTNKVSLDLSGVPSGLSDLRVTSEDCLGNISEATVPLKVIATPRFELPPLLSIPTSFGIVAGLVRPLDSDTDGLDTDGDGKDADYDQNSEVDLDRDGVDGQGPNDIVVYGATGVGWFRGKGDGTFQPFSMLFETPSVISVQVLDMTGDGLRDLLVLTSNAGVTTLLLVHQQQTLKADETVESVEFVEAETFTFPPEAVLTVMQVGDMNLDGFPDVIVGGPGQTYAAAVMLHSKKTEPPPAPPVSGDVVSQEGSDATGEVVEGPDRYLLDPAVLGGPYSVSGIVLGRFNGDSVPDLILGRGDTPLLSCVVNDKAGGFDISFNQQLYGEGTGVLAAANLLGSSEDDLVVSAFAQQALYVLEGNGWGCVNALGPLFEDEHTFGVQHVTNLIDSGFLDDGAVGLGEILSVGGTVDSIVIRDLNGDSIPDIAAAVPDANHLAVFVGDQSYQGRFRQGLFVEPGKAPHAMIPGHFDGDTFTDLACVVGDGTTVAILLNKGLNPEGVKPVALPRFAAPMTLPMPVAFDWQGGRLSPSHMLVDDFGEDGLPDVVVATAPDKQTMDWSGQDEERTLPLVLTYLSQKPPVGPPFPVTPPLKTATSLVFNQTLAGLESGSLDGYDTQADLALAVSATVATPCAGRNFDVMRGNYDFDWVHDKKELGGTGTDFYMKYGEYYGAPGQFWPLGGFLGVQAITGIAVAPLDTEPPDDVILFGPQQGTPGDPDFQPDTVATYLTQYDSNWVSDCPGYDQTHFVCAPYWPMEQTDMDCSGQVPDPGEDGEPVDFCHPETGGGVCLAVKDPADASDELNVGEGGKRPVAVVVADFDGDAKGCSDILAANEDSGDVTYLRGDCDAGVYKFHNPAKLPRKFAVGMKPLDIAAADFDQDGHLDAVVALEENVSVIWGVDGTKFESPVFLLKLSDGSIAPSSVEVGDVNQDGLTDIMMTVPAEDRIVVFVNGGQRDFVGPHTIPAGKVPVKVTVADMDNDKCDDVVVLNQEGRSVTVLRNLRCEK